ncbi:hypothetical protein HDIA_1971 [Hartmannibacter diazotrophicus]|uniref:MarR family protein n=1 Tax=Hartmannibacter diazotrophicus TaxID=1482074 RepID=A0A2C9D594_9HYPH|nr:helix-turn-helix domain-containing protein [Hartmannibacter diazotrophicus]SON55512.1 hypothetical protein HDIA_1971 [Hartmannibacter diazotrophicus]
MSTMRFSIIPAWIVTDARLKGRDLQVLCVLGRHIDRYGWCTRSQVKLAEELSCARSTVQASLDRLMRIGVVERRVNETMDGRDCAHDYRILFDAAPDLSMVPGPADDEPETGGPEGAETPLPTDRHPCRYTGTPAGPESAPPAGPGSAPYKNVPLKNEIERERAGEPLPRSPDTANPPEGTAGGLPRRPGDRASPEGTAGGLPHRPGSRTSPEGGANGLPHRPGNRTSAGLTRASAERTAAEAGNNEADEAFDAFFANWPTAAADDRGKARRAWDGLTPAKRRDATERAQDYLAYLKRIGRKHIVSSATYLAEMRWTLLADQRRATGFDTVVLAPFSKDWSAEFWRQSFGDGDEATAQNMLFEARAGRGWTVLATKAPTEAAVDALVAVKIGGEGWQAWRAYFAHHCRLLPNPSRVPVVYLPAEHPPPIEALGPSPERRRELADQLRKTLRR